MEWVEVKGPSVEVAIEAAMAELGIESRDAVDVEVLQEPERGFLGIGRQDAVVRVKPKPVSRSRRRRGKGRKESEAPRKAEVTRAGGREQKPSKPGRGAKARPAPGKEATRESGAPPPAKKEAVVNRDEQANVVREFLEGLLGAFGLDGEVTTRVEDDVVYADVTGNETEALIGSKGAVLQAIHELVKTVVQRKTEESARVRLDIAGYAERRREALKIYAERLAAQVLEEGGEIMLEPMNAAERKVIHDTIATITGVRTYSEGEEPRRSVVIAKVES